MQAMQRGNLQLVSEHFSHFTSGEGVYKTFFDKPAKKKNMQKSNFLASQIQRIKNIIQNQ